MQTLTKEEKICYANSRIKIILRSHKNIKKTLVGKLKHLFNLKAKLSEIATYQALLLFYGSELGLFDLDIDLQDPAHNNKADLKIKLLKYLKQNASEKQMSYYLHQLQKIINSPVAEPNAAMIVLHDNQNNLNVVLIDKELQVLDKYSIPLQLQADAWSNISFMLSKSLISFNIQNIIYASNPNFQKSLNTIFNNIQHAYSDLSVNIILVPIIGALGFAKLPDTIRNYSELTESQRAAIFLAKVAWHPKEALVLLKAPDIVFDPIQLVFDQKIWAKKIQELLTPSSKAKPKILNTAMADALKKLHFG